MSGSGTRDGAPVDGIGGSAATAGGVGPSTTAAGSGRVEARIVPKPWGHETIWAHTDRYVGKILHIRAGEALSVQYHERKDETVYLLGGHLLYRVQEGDTLRDVHLQIGQAYRIVPGTVHQMEAVTDCDVLEVSTPELDDVVRLTDRYGREGTSAP
jgi:mannose-6-phosphate isomerase-like protein (cupin superfamily)